MKRRTGSRVPAMADVAALAKVSVPTVSRVVQGTVPVSEEKRNRVLAAIEELDYRPSAAARALAHGTSTIVGVFAAQASAYGYAATIEGIHDESRRNGWTVAVGLLDSRPDDDGTALQRALDPILTQRLVGAIVIGFDPIAFDTIEILRRRHRVVVAAGSLSDIAGIDQVHLDEYAGAYDATTSLLELGHRTVHHVAVPGSQRDTGRTGGWRAALRDAGVVDIPEPWHVSWDPATAREVALAMPADGSVTAVLCGNDEIAIGLMRGLGERGLRVPDDVSVIGFDDHPLSKMLTPSLSSVRLDFAALGARAAAVLAAGSSSPSTSAVEPRLLLRESVRSAPPR
ncbi:LacI family transcriptional regulator [Labedella populi]|uniref:LacI family transcriptional regulator n=1 Tax=Labedella populi TaxID=2498850 RepID=A0A3S3ZYP2_9MICO|nr:LacI family DNA-binding transcriptional regulator [Labedella populi]RWZ67788.1 LacI family transcriptional regulator [Labedella populi]